MVTNLLLSPTSVFGNRTIVLIAHNLPSVLDFDKVVVMDKGAIVEAGRPRELLKTGDSVFREMYEVG